MVRAHQRRHGIMQVQVDAPSIDLLVASGHPMESSTDRTRSSRTALSVVGTAVATAILPSAAEFRRGHVRR